MFNLDSRWKRLFAIGVVLALMSYFADERFRALMHLYTWVCFAVWEGYNHAADWLVQKLRSYADDKRKELDD